MILQDERRWSLKHPHPHKVNIIDEVHEAQPPSTRSLITRNPRRHNEAIDRDDVLPVIGIPEKHRRLVLWRQKHGYQTHTQLGSHST